MTEQTGKVAKLTPEEWKQLVLLNTAQLQNHLQAIPGNTETGAAGLTEHHLALIDTHIGRGRAFMRAWSLATLEIAPVVQPHQAPVQHTNGAEPKGKGGWPKGKRRTPKVQPGAGQ